MHARAETTSAHAITQDPGLQAERTALAWSRTALALMVNGLLVLRLGWVAADGPVMCFAAGLLLGAAAVHVQGLRRRRELLTGPVPRAPRTAALRATAAITLLAAAGGLWSVLIP